MILVAGEALIDLFVLPDAHVAPTLQAHAGGSPFNLAVGLSRLDVPTAFLGGLSTDWFGRLLIDRLRNEGVDVSLAKRSSRDTPLVLVSPNAEGHPSYAFYAHEAADRDLGPADASAALSMAASAIAVGSYALAVEPVGSSLLTLAKRESLRIPIVVDCNLRPSMVGPLPAWRRRIGQFARCASIVKLSDEDFKRGWGELAQPDDHAAQWLQQGVKLVVMTHGARGVTAWHRCGRTNLPAVPTQVVDTVGAGDSFQAALLARLVANGLLNLNALERLDRAAIEDALRFALLAASLSCGRRGADPPRRAEVDQLMRAMRDQ